MTNKMIRAEADRIGVKRAESLGAEAYRTGKGVNDNPFPTGHKMYSVWEDAFKAEKKYWENL